MDFVFIAKVQKIVNKTGQEKHKTHSATANNWQIDKSFIHIKVLISEGQKVSFEKKKETSFVSVTTNPRPTVQPKRSLPNFDFVIRKKELQNKVYVQYFVETKILDKTFKITNQYVGRLYFRHFNQFKFKRVQR